MAAILKRYKITDISSPIELIENLSIYRLDNIFTRINYLNKTLQNIKLILKLEYYMNNTEENPIYSLTTNVEDIITDFYGIISNNNVVIRLYILPVYTSKISEIVNTVDIDIDIILINLESSGGGSGDGDMRKIIYDTNNSGRVDKAESLNDSTNVVTAQEAREHINNEDIHGGGGISEKFTNDDPTPIKVGGIEAGSTFENKSHNEMWMNLLYPELFPDLINPSHSFTMNVTGLREVGSILSTINFSASFNRGSINPAYSTSGFRSGLPNEYIYTGIGLSNIVTDQLSNTNTINNYEVVLGSQSWTCRVAYDEGEQPLSSFGNNYNSPLSAGQTSTITRTITGVYPVFATIDNIDEKSKLSLQSHGSVITVSMVGEDGTNKQSIDIPEAWGTITELNQYNTLSGNWDVISLSSFDVSDSILDINGYSINYKTYTHIGDTIGARQLRFII